MILNLQLAPWRLIPPLFFGLHGFDFIQIWVHVETWQAGIHL
jgi:hypothetical protein